MSVTVRAARPGDGGGVSRAWVSAASYYADLDPDHFQVPSDGALATGWDEQFGREGHDALIVHRDHWRAGAGTALLEAAEDWGREQGATVARLDTYINSPVSVPFYEERMGYERRSVVFQKHL